MNCRAARPLLSVERDQPLTPASLDALERHVAACPACRQERAWLAEASAAWRVTTAAQPAHSATTEWIRLRTRLADGARSAPEHRTAWWLSAGLLPLAAAALWFVVFGLTPPTPARAEYLETAANAAPLVYLDQESGWLIVWAEADETATSG